MPLNGAIMKIREVRFFTENEEEFVSLLIGCGMARNVATVLVFLAHAGNTTSRDIERGTDMRQPEVSIAMKYLAARGWVGTCEDISSGKGRPSRIYALAMPIGTIVAAIEKDAKNEVKTRLALLAKMQEYVR
jgi:predicted transcriptional regulator